MTNRQREQLIVRLYQQGKSYREIAQEARISVRDIKPILKKYESAIITDDICSDLELRLDTQDAKSYLPNSTKAYKLFAEGKNPLQVSIELNLRAPETQVLYKEYLDLRRMHFLSNLFDELGNEGLSSLIQLYNACRAQQISNVQIIDYLQTFENHLPAVKIQYNRLQTEVFELTAKKQQFESEIYSLNNAIGSSLNFLKSIQDKCNEIERERNGLAIQKLRLLKFVSEFENNNCMFRKVEQFVQEKVNRILRDSMKLLELSLMAALKAFKNDPNTYSYLFQKSDFAVTGELISRIPNENSYSKFHEFNTDLGRADKDPMIYSHSHDNLQYHTQKQKPEDYCHACYSYDADGISRTYSENLGKEIISDIGLNSFDGIYAVSHCAHSDHQLQY